MFPLLIIQGALEANSNHTLYYLQNVLSYIIIEHNMLYVSMKKKITKF